MNWLVIFVLANWAFGYPTDTTLNIVGSQRVLLPNELFRSQQEQEHILTRKDQLLRIHVGGVGTSVRRIMTPVRNQGARGTCSVFAALSLIEAFTGETYSPQCLAKMSSHRDPGRVEERLDYVRRNGLYYERDCPYDPTQRDNIPNISQASIKYFNSDFEVYPFREDDPIAYLKSRLAVSAPVAIEFFVVDRRQWFDGPFIYAPDASTIAMECGFLQSCAGHAVVVTGLNDTLGLIEFKNSWGTFWGKQGYGYLSYDYFLTFGRGVLVSY